MDTVRVLRIIEYVGPRDEIEKHLEHVVQGTKTFRPTAGQITIRAATIGTFPEILEAQSAQCKDA